MNRIERAIRHIPFSSAAEAYAQRPWKVKCHCHNFWSKTCLQAAAPVLKLQQKTLGRHLCHCDIDAQSQHCSNRTTVPQARLFSSICRLPSSRPISSSYAQWCKQNAHAREIVPGARFWIFSTNQPGWNIIGYTTVTIPPSGCGKLNP